jgi:Putative beta-barrel porin-2, OmpL-like. bbp2
MKASTWNRRRVCVVSGALALLVCHSAFAEEAPKGWFQQITLNAFASVGYTWNFNNPPSNTNQLRAFDVDHNSITIDAAELVIQKAVANKGDFGFRIDFTMGNVAKGAAARGLFRDPTTGIAQDFDLQQAFISYIIPIGHGLRFDLGKFVTPAGAELIEGYDGYNDNFSRGLLFTLAIPFTHTGFKLSYPFNDKFSVSAMLINGWDNVIDNNAAKSFGVSFAITPVAPLSIYVNYIGGPERDRPADGDFRHLVDAVIVYKPISRLTLTLNGDWALDTNAIAAAPSPLMTDPTDPAAAGSASNAQWGGLALYIRFQATSRFAAIARGEIFWDPDGFRTGTAQRVMELTLTPELKVTDAFLVRGEFRIDNSDKSFFVREDGLTRHYQPTIALNGLYVF